MSTLSRTIDEAVIALWRMNDNNGTAGGTILPDAAGFAASPLTAPNGLSWAQDAPGVGGVVGGSMGPTGDYVARLTSGSSQYLRAPVTLLRHARVPSISIAVWVKFVGGSANNQWVWQKSMNGFSLYLSLFTFGSKFRVTWGDPGVYGFAGAMTPVTGVWYRCVVVVGMRGLQLYVNGVLDINSTTPVLSDNVASGDQPFTFGVDARSGSVGGYSDLELYGGLNGCVIEQRTWTLADVLADLRFQPVPVAEAVELKKWVRSPNNPVLRPDRTFEAAGVQEPSVLKSSFDGKLKMFYTANFSASSIALAETDDLDSQNWVKRGVVIAGQAHTFQFDDGAGKIYSLIGDSASGQQWKWQVSSDGGFTFGAQTNFLALSRMTGINIADVVGNPSLTKLVGGPFDGTWFFLGEGNSLATSQWNLWGFTATTFPTTTWTALNGGNPLTSLSYGINSSYGGCSEVKWVVDHNGVGAYHLWYHATPNNGVLPSTIVHRKSTDLVTWTDAGAYSIIDMQERAFAYDQYADPSVVVYGGAVYLFYSLQDNPATAGWIGMLKFVGTLSDLVSDGVLPDQLGSVKQQNVNVEFREIRTG